MKAAVFQVSEYGLSRLIYVYMSGSGTLLDAESRMRESAGPKKHIAFLGSFDSVQKAMSMEEAQALVSLQTATEERQPVGVLPTIEDAVNRICSMKSIKVPTDCGSILEKA